MDKDENSPLQKPVTELAAGAENAAVQKTAAGSVPKPEGGPVEATKGGSETNSLIIKEKPSEEISDVTEAIEEISEEKKTEGPYSGETQAKEVSIEGGNIVEKQPAPEPATAAEEPARKQGEAPSKLKSIRTYRSDVAETIKGGKTSLIGITVAEEERREAEEMISSPRSKKNIVFVFVSLALLLGGITVTVISIFNKPGTGVIQKIAGPAPLVFAENEKVISATNSSPETLARSISNEVANANNKLDTVENIYITENVNGSETAVNAQRFFFFTDSRMPPSLLRSLNNNFALGFHTFNGNHPFLVLKTGFYENAFAGMLGWEQYMARDIFPIFGIKKKEGSAIFLRPFEDKTVKNLDARVLKDDDGEILLFYVFKDKGTIIITDSENTLSELVKRLNYSGAASN